MSTAEPDRAEEGDPVAGPDPSWRLIDVTVPATLGEIVSDRLWALGVQGIEERPVDSGDLSRVCLRTRLDMDPADVLSRLGLDAHDHLATSDVVVTSTEVSRAAADNWREHAEPSWVDSDHVIVPAWIAAPTARIVVRIEPVDQFGMGNHDTTLLAGRLLLSAAHRGSTWLDLGAGSGVLAVLGALSCQARFLVHDIDTGSRNVSLANAALNSCEGDVQWIGATAEVNEGALDGVVANILAPVLRQLAPEIIRMVRGGGVVVLSGMLESQVDEVVRFYGDCSVVGRVTSGQWCAVALLRH